MLVVLEVVVVAVRVVVVAARVVVVGLIVVVEPGTVVHVVASDTTISLGLNTPEESLQFVTMLRFSGNPSTHSLPSGPGPQWPEPMASHCTEVPWAMGVQSCHRMLEACVKHSS